MTSDREQTQTLQCDTERDVQRILADWLAGNGFEVFWDRDPPEEYRRFRIANSSDHPDLVAIGSEDIIVIEVKNANDSAAVYDAMVQTHR